jgi:hypothetical protein
MRLRNGLKKCRPVEAPAAQGGHRPPPLAPASARGVLDPFDASNMGDAGPFILSPW